jgi:hypothetical protein
MPRQISDADETRRLNMNDVTVQQWIDTHSGKKPSRAFLAAAARAEAGAVFGLATIGGQDAQSALAADREVERLLKQPGATQPGTAAFQKVVAQLVKSPLTGVTSITSLALQKSGWNPATPNAAGGVDSAVQYGANIGSAPFFSLVQGTRSVSVNDDDNAWIVGLLSRALALFAPGQATFVENAIIVTGSGVQLAITRYAPDSANPNSVTLQQTIYALNTALWGSVAEKIAGIGVTDASAWLTEFVTPRQA